MKSNVILESKDRILFGITIRQDTKKEFLSLSDLQESYTIARLKNGWSDRRINDILSSNTSSERVYYILKERGFIEAGISAFMDEVQKTSLVRVMKKYGAYKTVGRGENRTTMCEKYIWIMLALELNPEIYAKVVCWIGDSLIINRIEAGDKYNDLCRACSKFKDVDYRIIAKERPNKRAFFDDAAVLNIIGGAKGIGLDADIEKPMAPEDAFEAKPKNNPDWMV